MTAPSVAGGAGFKTTIKGIPLWAWGIIGIGTVYALTKMRATPAAATPPATAPGYATAGNMPLTVTGSDNRILTNTQWSLAAQKDLVQKGHNALAADTAVRAYLSNQSLTPDQQVLIDIALVDIGPVPNMIAGAGADQTIDLNPLHTPTGGNLLGEAAYGLGDFLGLSDPSNPASGIFAPLFNDYIDQGPIGGFFASMDHLLGGALNISGSVPAIDIPGVGSIGLGGNIGPGGFSLSGSGPGGVGGGISLAPGARTTYIGTVLTQPGDTLTTLSQAVYGSPGGAQLLYSANVNKLPDPSHIPAGVVLQVPAPSSNT